MRRPLSLLLLLALPACVTEPGSPGVPLNPLLRGDETYGVPASLDGIRRPFAAKGFNAFIINAANSFGAADYLWEGDGVTRDIYYKSTLIATPYAADKCHCVGATFQVYITAFEAWDEQYAGSSGDLKGLTADDMKKFKSVWYVATADEAGAQAALVDYKVGSKVADASQAEQGDLIQFWRNNGTGHSVIFDSWVQQDSTITGITYFSCQGSGPGFVSETIGTGATEVISSRIYIGHPFPPTDLPDAGPPEAGTDEGGIDDGAGGDLPPVLGDAPTGREPEGCECALGSPGLPPLPLLLLLVAVGIRRRRW
jgi:MYXO-CTERM domain-containing protein